MTVDGAVAQSIDRSAHCDMVAFDDHRDCASMADHPWPRRRKALGATSGFLDKPRRFGRTTPAARTMRRFVLIKRLGRVGAALVGGVRLSPFRRHAKEIRRPQDHARRGAFALRTIMRGVAFGHRPHVRERAAIVTHVIVNRHFQFPALKNPKPVVDAGQSTPDDRPASFAGRLICPVRATRRHRP
jgi:hypothetical protein